VERDPSPDLLPGGNWHASARVRTQPGAASTACMPIKDIYLYPLRADFRRLLCAEEDPDAMHAKYFTPRSCADGAGGLASACWRRPSGRFRQLQARSQQLSELRSNEACRRDHYLENLLESPARGQAPAAPFGCRSQALPRAQTARSAVGHPGGLSSRPMQTTRRSPPVELLFPSVWRPSWGTPGLEQYIEELPVIVQMTRLRTYEALARLRADGRFPPPLHLPRHRAAGPTWGRALALAADLSKDQTPDMRKHAQSYGDHSASNSPPAVSAKPCPRGRGLLRSTTKLQVELCQAPVVHVDRNQLVGQGASGLALVFTHIARHVLFCLPNRGRRCSKRSRLFLKACWSALLSVYT